MPRTSRPPDLYTIGHSTLSLEALLARLRSAKITGLADVRRFPTSRRHPHFNRAALEETMPAKGIEYRWFEALGGRRSWRDVVAPRPDVGPNQGLRIAGFRAYADYALTPAFREALDALVEWARSRRVAVCCAEALCHRRIIADHLVARGHAVLHIPREGEPAAHELWELARVSTEGVTYPPEQVELPIPARPAAEELE